MNIQQLIDNLELITGRIKKAAEQSGRPAESVKLIAVTKGQPVEVITQALDLGIKRFGENYPEETDSKIRQLPGLENEIEWHMIGHIQSRKKSYIVDHFSFIHSVDGLHVAEVLSKELVMKGKSLPVLLEMNLTGEKSKFGFPAWDDTTFDNTLKEIEEIFYWRSIFINGLMTMPPLSEDPNASRVVYKRLQDVQTILKKKYPDQNWTELSMGSSFDFDVAIQEGATMIRIGQALFGPRIQI